MGWPLFRGDLLVSGSLVGVVWCRLPKDDDQSFIELQRFDKKHYSSKTARTSVQNKQTFQVFMYTGDGHPTFNRNPYNGYINPYYWVDEFIPYYMEIMGDLTLAHVWILV